MSKNRVRFERLFKKTHLYVPFKDLVTIRDYFRAWFDELEKPPNLDEIMAEIEEVVSEFGKGNNREVHKKLGPLLKTSLAAHVKWLIPWAEENCERYPDGKWLPRELATYVPLYLRDAKIFFERRKTDADEAEQ